jgi:hypothetical protein
MIFYQNNGHPIFNLKGFVEDSDQLTVFLIRYSIKTDFKQ